MISRGLFALRNLMLFNSKFLIKRRVLLEAAWAAAAEFCVFNVIRETAGVGAEHPAHRQSQVGGGSSWDRRPERCEPRGKRAGTQPGSEVVGQFPSWLPRLVSSWGSGEWVVAICVSSLVTCAAADDSAQFAVCRAVCVCSCSFSISWHVGEYLWEEGIKQVLVFGFILMLLACTVHWNMPLVASLTSSLSPWYRQMSDVWLETAEKWSCGCF